MKNLRLILVLLGFNLPAFSVNTDSLARAVKTMPRDSNLINALYTLATEVGKKDSTAGMKYANEMLAYGSELMYGKGIAKGWQAKGQIAYEAHSFKRAIYYFEKSSGGFKECSYTSGILDCNFWLARCYRRTADYTLYAKYLALVEDDAKGINNTYYISRAYEGYGNLYRYLGQYSRSIENYTKSIDISDKTGRADEEAIALNNLSLVYGLLGQPEDELKIELRSYKLTLSLKDSSNMVLCLGNLAGLYQGMNKMDTAWKCIDRAMNIIKIKGEENINFKDAASAYSQYSSLAAAQKDFKTAVEFQNKNINLSKENGDIKTVANGYSSLADIFILMGNKTFAEEYFLKSLDINKEIGFINGQMGNYQSLADLYKDQKNTAKADAYGKLYEVLKDSVAAMTNVRKLSEAQALYKINEQRQELLVLDENKKIQELELQKKKCLNYIMTGGFILVFIIGLFVFLRYKNKRSEA